MRFCWSSSHSFNGLDWQSFIFVSDEVYQFYFGKLVQNTFCKLPQMWLAGLPGPETVHSHRWCMWYVFGFGLTTWWLSFSKACITCGQWPWYRSQGVTVNSLYTNFMLQGEENELTKNISLCSQLYILSGCCDFCRFCHIGKRFEHLTFQRCTDAFDCQPAAPWWMWTWPPSPTLLI